MNNKLLVFFAIAVLLVSVVGFTSTASASTNKENIIVSFSNPTNKEVVKGMAVAAGGRVKYDWPELNMIAIRDLPETAINRISMMRGVKKIYKDELKHAIDLDESAYLINSDKVWAQGITGNGIRVCVVDTGVGPHPNLNVVAQHDFYNNDDDASDDHGHGTHCAGIVASTHNTYKGNAPSVEIMAAKTINSQGSGYESDTVDGILWCAKGPDGIYETGDEAKVITISLGFSTHSGTCDDQPAADAANIAVDHGVTVVAASGNDCSSTDIGNPACGSKVIAVGAVYDADVGSKSWCCNWICTQTCTDSPTYADKVTCFSNGNSELDVVAPGSIITSTVPTGNCDLCDSSGFNDVSGTSQATPHVAGVAALLLEENPNLTPADIRQVLRNTSVDLGQPFNRQGYGRVDAYAAWNAVKQQCTLDSDCNDNNECTNDICNVTTGKCINNPVSDNTACTGGICCGGTCTGATCSVNTDCNDGNSCTIDSCYNGGTCSAYCGYQDITQCINDDGCCPSGCDYTNDNDCSSEYCGNGYCAGSANGEDCNTCPSDCIGGQGGTCSACFKGVCDGKCNPAKEDSDCSDCASSYCCGDGTCEGAEDATNCYVDCGGTTTTTTTSTTTTTTSGECIPNGGLCNCNGKCAGQETHETCPWDCP